MSQDMEDIEKFYNFLERNDEPLAYQCFYASGGATSQKFVNSLQELKAEVIQNEKDGLNCLSINPRDEDETGIEGVTHISTIFIDVDVKSEYKEDGISTEDDKQLAMSKVREVNKKLDELGFDYDMIVDSGNGYHIYLSVDIPMPPVNSKEGFKNTPTFKKLERLSQELQELSGEFVEVDSVTSDIARRAKMAGTFNVKPDMSEDSEIRQAEILELEDELNTKKNSKAFSKLDPIESGGQQGSDPTPSDEDTGGNDHEKGDTDLKEWDKIEKAREFDDTFDDLMSGSDIKNDRSFSEYILVQKAVFYGFNPEGCLAEAGIGKYQERGSDYAKAQTTKAERKVTDRFDWSEFKEKSGKERDSYAEYASDRHNYVQMEDRDHYHNKSRDFQPPPSFLETSEVDGEEVEHIADFVSKQHMAREFSSYLVEDKFLVRAVIYQNNVKDGVRLWHRRENDEFWTAGGGEQLIRERAWLEGGYARDFHSTGFVNQCREYCLSIRPEQLEDTGTEEGEIPVKNGVLEWESEKCRDAKPQDLIKSPIRAKYNPDAGMPDQFLDFLNDVVADEDDINKLQEYLGYSLTDSMKHKKMCIILGSQNSGKSVLLEVLERFFGIDNVSSQALEALANDKFSRHNLVGNRINMRHDLDGRMIENTGRVKELASGDTMDAENKHESKYQFRPTQKHFYSANDTPSIPDDAHEESFYERFLTLTFPREIPKEEQEDKDKLVGRMTTDEELSAILNWALEGLKRLEEKGSFTNERTPYETQEKWKEYGSTLEKFVRKYTVTRPQMLKQKKKEKAEQKELHTESEEVREAAEEEVKKMDWNTPTALIYQLYEKYALGMGDEVKPKNAVTQEVQKLSGVNKTRLRYKGSQRRGFDGIRLAPQAHDRIEEKVEEKIESIG